MKANEFDKKIKAQAKKVEHTLPTGIVWDINKSWNQIAQMLKHANPKSFVWYFSLAASISMVMANTGLITSTWKRPEAETITSLEDSPLSTIKINPSPSAIQPSIHDSIQIKLVNSKDVVALPSISSKLVYADINPPSASNGQRDSQYTIGRFKPILNAGMNRSGVRLSCELMFITNKTIKNASIGMSLEMNTQFFTNLPQEAALLNYSHHALYMNVVVLNESAKRPWSARIGTPLWQSNNRDDNAPALKMNYQTKIGKRVFIGPEIIFSKGFKQVYPGISLSFG
jgi:hypothetical protein